MHIDSHAQTPAYVFASTHVSTLGSAVLVKTRSRKVCIVSSLFGGMAGCALMGQSVINVGNGGHTRLSPSHLGWRCWR